MANCPECGAMTLDAELLIDDDGGDYAGELVEFWRYYCHECGASWDRPYHGNIFRDELAEFYDDED